MHIEKVEIYSDRTNAVVMRHPDRVFPGVLVQGDSLFILCKQADLVCQQIGQSSEGFEEANDLRNSLWSYLNHYKATLVEHAMEMPFSD